MLCTVQVSQVYGVGQDDHVCNQIKKVELPTSDLNANFIQVHIRELTRYAFSIFKFSTTSKCQMSKFIILTCTIFLCYSVSLACQKKKQKKKRKEKINAMFRVKFDIR